MGFNPASVLSTGVSPPAFRLFDPGSEDAHIYDRLLERLESVPGIAGVAMASKIPPEAGGNQVLEVHNRPVAIGSEVHAMGADAVIAGFFDILDIPLRRGRPFSAQDRENSQPVAIVNEALAEEYFPNLARSVDRIRIPGGCMPWLTNVGVAGNLKHTRLMNEISWVETPILYRPLAQEPCPAIRVDARVAGDASAAGREIQRQIAAVDPLIPLVDVESLSSRLAKTLAYPRFRLVQPEESEQILNGSTVSPFLRGETILVVEKMDEMIQAGV